MIFRIFILPVALVMAGCASTSADERSLSILEARRLANTRKEQRVRVQGYFFYHFEGSSLEPKPGEASLDGIRLRWTSRPALEPLKPIAAFSGEFVEVEALLKKGPIRGSRIGDVAYLELSSIKRANKAPEPTSGTVTPPAEPGVAPVPPVAHL